MILRKDIDEGCEFEQMPKIGFGRILSALWIEEIYVTMSICGLRIFAARGLYDGPPNKPRWRWRFVH